VVLKGLRAESLRKALFEVPIMYPPLKWQESVANDTFSIRFDDGLGWVSV
jgi:hypothetical protein